MKGHQEGTALRHMIRQDTVPGTGIAPAGHRTLTRSESRCNRADTIVVNAHMRGRRGRPRQRPSSARTTAKLPNSFRYLRSLIISPSTSLGRARSMSTSTHLRVTLSFQRPHPSPLLTMHDICPIYTVPTRTVGPCEYLLLYALCDMRDSMSGASLFEVLPWSCAPHVSSASSAVFRQLMTCMTCDVACGYRRILSQSLFMVFPYISGRSTPASS